MKKIICLLLIFFLCLNAYSRDYRKLYYEMKYEIEELEKEYDELKQKFNEYMLFSAIVDFTNQTASFSDNPSKVYSYYSIYGTSLTGSGGIKYFIERALYSDWAKNNNIDLNELRAKYINNLEIISNSMKNR